MADENVEAVPDDGGDEPRDLRYRKELFPQADRLVFHTKRGGFIPLPIILRRLFRVLTLVELRMLVYLHLRASKYGICYPPVEEMLHELDLATKKHLGPPIRALETKGFISTRSARGRTFYLIHDPRVAIKRMATQGKLTQVELNDLNDLYRDLKQPPVAIDQAELFEGD